MREVTPNTTGTVKIGGRVFEYGPSDIKRTTETVQVDRGCLDKVEISYVETPAGRVVVSRKYL